MIYYSTGSFRLQVLPYFPQAVGKVAQPQNCFTILLTALAAPLLAPAFGSVDAAAREKRGFPAGGAPPGANEKIFPKSSLSNTA
ncbi:hypothetical protein [Caproiciproducens sp. CPB-2]|uniref:hypothetical protein n=1 Tax=Caproiciproducens sp. CPB-2 TaxID=3030017 RepID=UPI0023DB9C9F|nr:hypothetical protein [Caproiciproducens sp. CPB-2]MDF1494464.1 hypothetical protein [Caproiciproducens sp. CPB-2]